MRRINFLNKITLCFFALIFTTSCNIQNSTSLQKDETKELKSSKASHPKIVKTQGSSPADNVFCGLLDKSGNLWFGTTGEGIYHFDGKSFTNYTTKDGINSNSIWSMIEDKNGNILFGTGKGICRFDGKSFIDITKDTNLEYGSIYSMLEDKKGRLWVCDYKTAYEIGGGTYLYNPSTKQTNGETFVKVLSIDSIQKDEDLTLKLINCILEDADGNIWFSGQNRDGVVIFDGKSLIKFDEEARLYDNVYRSMLIDKNGNLWLGGHLKGVFSYISATERDDKKIIITEKVRFSNITENTGLSKSTIMSMIEDEKGNLWFSSDGEGVWRYDGKSFKNFNTEDGLLNNSVFSIVEDREGNLWFGTRNTGLYRYDGKSIECFSE
jgi:ligand-binding sensor domain-containing protein